MSKEKEQESETYHYSNANQIYPNTKVELKTKQHDGSPETLEIKKYNFKKYFFKNGFEIINLCHEILEGFTTKELLQVETYEKDNIIYWIFPRSFNDKKDNSIVYVPHTNIWCISIVIQQ